MTLSGRAADPPCGSTFYRRSMHKKPRRFSRRIIAVVTLAYLALVAVATLGPSSIAGGVFDLVLRAANELPLGEVTPADVEFAANVVMFLPLGALFVLLLGPRYWGWALVAGVALTFGIEGVQGIIPGRVQDTRDLIANGGGAIAGALIGHLVVQPRRRALRFVALGVVTLVVGGVAANTLVPQSMPLALADTAAPSPAIQAQLDYVARHWSDRNVDGYGSLGDTDCVNFASQSLEVRGWPQTDEWWHTEVGGHHSYSSAWISSGEMFRYFERHPELATFVDDFHRDRVALGDIVQFDWDSNGAVDHTGIVNRIDDSGAVIQVYYASHSSDRESQGVDAAIERDGRGGTISYWHLER